MTRSAFEQLVTEGIERVPARFRAYLDEIAIVVETEATREQKRAAGVAQRDELLGLYEGIPHTQRAGMPHRLPDVMTLFHGPLERVSGGNPERVREEVAHTVWHELAHALGMPEGRVRRAERRRRSRRAVKEKS